MKTFTQFLKESDADFKKQYDFNNKITTLMAKTNKDGINLFNVVNNGIRKNKISELDMKLFDIKKKGDAIKFVTDFYKPLQQNCDQINKYTKDPLWAKFKRESGSDIAEIIQILPDYINRYTNIAKNYDKIFDYLKKGEAQDSAIKKIVEMCKKVKMWDWKSNKESSYTMFDPYDETDILQQIDKFKGTVKLSGTMDMYLKFENEKLKDWWF